MTTSWLAAVTQMSVREPNTPLPDAVYAVTLPRYPGLGRPRMCWIAHGLRYGTLEIQRCFCLSLMLILILYYF